MMKKISYLCLAFAFSFLCFSYNVKAFSTTINNDSLSIINDYFFNRFSDEQLLSMKSVFDNSNYNVCNIMYYSSSDVRVFCYDGLFNDVSNYFNAVRGVLLNSSNYSLFNLNNFSLPNTVYSYSYFDIYSISSSVKSYVLWVRDDFVYNGSNSVIFSSEIYDNFPSNLKTYYDFQHFVDNGYPFYSYINLRLGNWKGYAGNVELIKCFDNVCDNSGTNFSYKYGTVGESIDLTSELDSEYNGYNLDLNYTYSINAGQTSTLNIYYYSTQIPYTIFYYFDNELQSNLTESLSGSNGSLISLDNLDSVKNDIYYLDTTRDYSITLTSGQTNSISVYYNSIDVNYDINVYLDDIYYKSYSSIGTGKVGQTITLDNLDSEIDIFTLDLREYELLLSENRELNYVNVYYYSDNYDTKYQDIDTTGKFYISFDWVYIKELFNLKGLYTQTEQFIIVYVVNFLFYAIVCIFAVIGIKMLFRLFNLFKMF